VGIARVWFCRSVCFLPPGSVDVANSRKGTTFLSCTDFLTSEAHWDTVARQLTVRRRALVQNRSNSHYLSLISAASFGKERRASASDVVQAGLRRLFLRPPHPPQLPIASASGTNAKTSNSVHPHASLHPVFTAFCGHLLLSNRVYAQQEQIALIHDDATQNTHTLTMLRRMHTSSRQSRPTSNARAPERYYAGNKISRLQNNLSKTYEQQAKNRHKNPTSRSSSVQTTNIHIRTTAPIPIIS
jgi:hypothetical protein